MTGAEKDCQCELLRVDTDDFVGAEKLAQKAIEAAEAKYIVVVSSLMCENKGIWEAATSVMSATYNRALLDDARALCGHPMYELSYRHWCAEALAVLELFV